MSEICPRCGAVLHLLFTSDEQKTDPIRWCMACAFTSERPVAIRATAERISPDAILRIRTRGRGSPGEWKRWEMFESLLATTEADGVFLKDAYEEAAAHPGRWVTTTPIVSIAHIIRALLGLPWQLCEPPMAVRCSPDGASVDLLLNAYKLMSAAQLRPRWRDLVRGPWHLHWAERV